MQGPEPKQLEPKWLRIVVVVVVVVECYCILINIIVSRVHPPTPTFTCIY